MDLLQLEYFVHVAESPTMLQAAELLNVSPSTLSMSIKKLEGELDTTLLRRTGRGLKLTEEGQLLHEGASRILFEVSSLKDRILSLRESRRNSVIIATDAVDYATETIYLYSALHSDHNIEHLRMRHTAMRTMLLSRQADLTITLQPVIDDNIESTLLLSEPMYLLANAESRFADMPYVRMRDVLDETLITLPKGHSLRDLFESYYTMLGFSPHTVLEVGELEALSMSVKKRFGITFVPQSVQGSEVFYKDFNFSVCARPMQESFCYRNLYLSRLKYPGEGKEMRSYLQFLHNFTDLVTQLKRFPDLEEYKATFMN